MLPPPPHGPALPRSTMWKPGVSPNPGGAPKGKRVSTWMAEYGQMDPSDWPDMKTAKIPANARIALVRLKRAMDETAGAEGERAAEIIMDRTEGKVDQTLNLRRAEAPLSLPEAAEIVRRAGIEGEVAPPELPDSF